MRVRNTGEDVATREFFLSIFGVCFRVGIINAFTTDSVRRRSLVPAIEKNRIRTTGATMTVCACEPLARLTHFLRPPPPRFPSSCFAIIPSRCYGYTYPLYGYRGIRVYIIIPAVAEPPSPHHRRPRFRRDIIVTIKTRESPPRTITLHAVRPRVRRYIVAALRQQRRLGRRRLPSTWLRTAESKRNDFVLNRF